MPEKRHVAMKEYYSNKNGEQNESVAGDLDALGRRMGNRSIRIVGPKQVAADLYLP